MSRIRDAALELAQAGYPVLALEGITDSLTCTCSAGASCQQRPGKHPNPALAPSGAYSATRDVATIEAWPEPYNIGMSLGFQMGPYFVNAIDFDDPDVCSLLRKMDEEDELRPEVITRTGRGYHVWVRCTAETKNGIMSDTTGIRLGEIRSTGQYVVLPPSRHLSGSYYAWTGPSIAEEPPPVYEGNAWGYAARFLKQIGVTLADQNQWKELPEWEGTIEAADLTALGFSPSTLIVSTMDPGAVNHNADGTPNRHETLFWLACQIWREALSVGALVQPETVAAILKRKDVLWGSAAKFAHRRGNADANYWVIATRALESVEADQKATADEAAAEGAASGYSWDGKAFTYKAPGGKGGAVLVANFEARIVEVVRDAESGLGDWVLVCRRGDQSRRIRLSPNQWADPNRFVRELEVYLPSDWRIRDLEWRKKFRLAVQAYSGSVPERVMRRSTGWVDELDKFLLPDPRGAITSKGWDGEIILDDREGSLPRRHYADADVAEMLGLLFRSSPPSIIVPLSTQIFAAPLTSLVLSDRRTIVHLHGPTNSYKTTLVEAVFGIYGYTPAKQDMGIHSWAATDNFLADAIHQMRDLPVLADDYKTEQVKNTNVTRIIQMLGDEQQRSRMRVSREGGVVASQSRAPRALGVSTGEDIWWDQKSKVTRTFFVPISQGMELAPIAALQFASRSGALSALGVAWIRWLCSRGRERIKREFEEQVRRTADFVEAYVPRVANPRLHYSANALLAISGFVGSFVDEQAPGFRDEYREIRLEGWKAALAQLGIQADSADNLSPAIVVRDTIRELLVSAGGSLVPWRGESGAFGVGPVIGWWGWEDGVRYVYLTKSTTWHELSVRAHRSGNDLMFGWENFVSEAKRIWGADNLALWSKEEKASLRTVRIASEKMGLEMDDVKA